ncbi:MAG: MFS transporter [Pirellulaceae bacterium]|nr:MFS transporter [Pirellulaceae bacterium]
MHDSRIRYWMVFLAMLVAVLLYLDRICLSTASESVVKDLKMDPDQLKWILGAFFWTYAFAQLPAGWLGDRYGARWILSAYVALWSLSTALLGFVGGVTSLLVLRLACGLFEAGAYPVCAGIVRNWVPASHRGLASGLVSVGGRLGGAIAPLLTIELMLLWTYGGERWSVATLEPAVTSWRPVMMLYGGAGIVIAIIFVWLYRDNPQTHPLVSKKELDIIAGDKLNRALNESDTSTDSQKPVHGLPLRAFMTSRSLWLMSFVQFASNFGWAFLVTMMPRYLKDVHGVSQQAQGWMQSVPLAAGIVGLLVGGSLTDWATRRWGLRYGRAILLVASRVLVGFAFVGCLMVKDPIQATLYLAMVGFATDLGIGAVWAYGQDVGGRHVGSVMGWGNMWGNIGAALSPIVLGLISEAFVSDIKMGWQVAFIFCAALQLIAAFASIGVSADKKLA